MSTKYSIQILKKMKCVSIEMEARARAGYLLRSAFEWESCRLLIWNRSSLQCLLSAVTVMFRTMIIPRYFTVISFIFVTTLHLVHR